jgi:hypothetical protein
MGFDLKEIAKSWLISASPSLLQKEIAQKRYNICLQCEYYNPSRVLTHDEYCIDCGCPLSKKIFSPKFDACKLHKWFDVDTQYKEIYFNKQSKNNKTLL